MVSCTEGSRRHSKVLKSVSSTKIKSRLKLPLEIPRESARSMTGRAPDSQSPPAMAQIAAEDQLDELDLHFGSML